MWTLKKIFGEQAGIWTRITGGAAIGSLSVGLYNLLIDGVPTLQLLVYRGGVILVGVCLLFLAAHLAERSE